MRSTDIADSTSIFTAFDPSLVAELRCPAVTLGRSRSVLLLAHLPITQTDFQNTNNLHAKGAAGTKHYHKSRYVRFSVGPSVEHYVTLSSCQQ